MSRHRQMLMVTAIAVLSVGVRAKDADPVPLAGKGQPPAAAQAAPLSSLLQFPCAMEEIVPAGGGKFLVVYLKKLQQIAIVEVSQSRIVKYIPLPSSDVALAAGAKKFFIGMRDLKQIQQWDLAKLERETSFPAPPGGIQAMAMGADSVGPLIVLGEKSAKRTWIVNPASLLAYPMPSHNWGGDGAAWGPVHIHASYDGSAVISTGGGWAGIELASIVGGRVVHVEAHYSAGTTSSNGDTLVSGNGSLVFLHKGEILRDDLASKVSGIEGHPFAALDPGFSVASNQLSGKTVVTIFNNGDPHAILTLDTLTELNSGSSFDPEQRVYLIPREKALVTVGPGDDRLTLRYFDLAEALDQQGRDYLFVESAPPSIAIRGQTYKYKILVRSKKGPVKLTLQSAPKNMTMSRDGTLSWLVPPQFKGEDPSVIVQLEDAGGQQAFHNFRITLNDIVRRAPEKKMQQPIEVESHRTINLRLPRR